MKLVAAVRFDDGSKKGPKRDYEVGEAYKGPNGEKLLGEGLLKEAEPEAKKEKKESKDKKGSEKPEAKKEK